MKRTELEELINAELELELDLEPDEMEEMLQTTQSKSVADHHTLPELCLGIVLFGICCLIVGIFFVKDRSGYSIGLGVGTLAAVLAAVHMWWALDRALDRGEDAARKMITAQSLLRYGCIVIAMGLIMVSGFANPLAFFLGLMGLKVAAYLQPLIHRLYRKIITKKE